MTINHVVDVVVLRYVLNDLQFDEALDVWPLFQTTMTSIERVHDGLAAVKQILQEDEAIDLENNHYSHHPAQSKGKN